MQNEKVENWKILPRIYPEPDTEQKRQSKTKNKIKLLRENQNKAETREQFRNADSNTKVSELFLEKIKTTQAKEGQQKCKMGIFLLV